jgi:hypothetical protein
MLKTFKALTVLAVIGLTAVMMTACIDLDFGGNNDGRSKGCDWLTWNMFGEIIPGHSTSCDLVNLLGSDPHGTVYEGDGITRLEWESQWAELTVWVNDCELVIDKNLYRAPSSETAIVGGGIGGIIQRFLEAFRG